MDSATIRALPTSRAGFTLVEVMVAVVILLVGLLGLLQSVNIATEQNMKNMFRQEATRLLDNRLMVIKSLPYENVSSNHEQVVTSMLHGIDKKFVMTTNISPITNTNSKVILLGVRWSYKNYSTTQRVRTVITE